LGTIAILQQFADQHKLRGMRGTGEMLAASFVLEEPPQRAIDRYPAERLA